MSEPRRIAKAFSGHRFREVYDVLAPDVRWTLVGDDVVTGRQAVIDVCEGTVAQLSQGTAEFLRFVTIADDDAAAVDVLARYVDADGDVSLVSSCDVYEFGNGLLTSITSYTVELDSDGSGGDPAPPG